MAIADPILSGTVLPTAGVAAGDSGTTGWKVDWSSPFVTLDWTKNRAYVPGNTIPQGTLNATLDFVSAKSPPGPSELVKTLHFTDTTPNTVESSFGLRFNMNVKVINDTPDAWSQFAFKILTTDKVADEGGSLSHPWAAHFHDAGFNPGPFTVQSPLDFGGSWLNASSYANLTGTLAGRGGTANINGIGVHDYESLTKTRTADLVFVANGSFPVLPVDEFVYRSFRFRVKPGTTVPGTVRITEPDGTTTSDYLVFTNVPGNANLFQVDMFSNNSDGTDAAADKAGNLPFSKRITELGMEGAEFIPQYNPTGADPGTALDPAGQPISYQVTSDLPPSVPEPSTLALFGTGLLGMWVAVRHRRRACLDITASSGLGSRQSRRGPGTSPGGWPPRTG